MTARGNWTTLDEWAESRPQSGNAAPARRSRVRRGCPGRTLWSVFLLHVLVRCRRLIERKSRASAPSGGSSAAMRVSASKTAAQHRRIRASRSGEIVLGFPRLRRPLLGKKVQIVTFNLSQLSGPQEIIGALHQVRDLALTGKHRHFLDEFDSQGYKSAPVLLGPDAGRRFQGRAGYPSHRQERIHLRRSYQCNLRSLWLL